MLPKKNRISRALFDTLLKKGIFFHSQNLSFRVVKTLTGKKELSKFSFVASKKVSKSAVKRNLLRRRGYSALKDALGNEKIRTGGVLGAFFFKKGAEKIGFSELHSEISLLLKKSGIV